jgi:hypothetical protein
MPQPLIITNNSFQSNTDSDRSYAIGNLSVENPTVEQLNEAISLGCQWAPTAPANEPIFGQHIRQATEVVRRMFDR